MAHEVIELHLEGVAAHEKEIPAGGRMIDRLAGSPTG